MRRTRDHMPAGSIGSRRRGQVLIIALIGMGVLVGLVFYVYNAGDQINRRLEMQGAADAVAVTGAGWMARSMNVVAMNNVGEAKMISLVPVLDTQPLASAMAMEEVAAWEQALAGIVRQPRIDPRASAQTETYLREGTESLRARMEVQRDILRPFAESINRPNFDMETITHWAKPGTPGSPPHGKLWRAAMTMEEFSRAAVATCGELAQQRAARMGRRDGATAAFLSPVLPEMPARLGEYMDFQPPIRGYCKVFSEYAGMRPTGGNGGAIPDMAYPHRLGPWARLHRWRHYDSQFIETGREWVPGTPGRGESGGVDSAMSNIGGRTVGRRATSPNDRGRPGGWNRQGYSEVNAYRTYGPYWWAKDHIHWWARGTNEDPGKLRDTLYYTYLRIISDIKVDYMFPAGGIGEITRTQEIHYPNWIVDYPVCVQIGSNPDNQVTSTMFYVVEIASKYPDGSPGFMTPGTFRTNGEYPIAQWVQGWYDPAWLVDANDPNCHVQQVSNYVWKEESTYWTEGDPELGIRQERIPPGDPDGAAVRHTVYYYQWLFFGGIDIGGTVEVSNPANWDQFERLPVPILIDTSTGDYGGDDPDEGWRRERFMYLGVARKRTEAPVWPQKFSHVNPLEGMLTIAQAKVFNNKSWDLWTQDWRVQLAPVTKLGPESNPESWVARLVEDITSSAQVDSVETEEVETAHQYLSSLDPEMARLYLNH